MSISKSIVKLENKVEQLEESLNKLQSKTKDMINDIGFTVYTKNLLNLNIIDNYKFHLRTLDNPNKNSQFYQVKIRFLNYSEQDITFNLFADNLQIANDTQAYNKGINEAVIYGTYSNLISDKIVIELQVKPRANKQLTILNTTMTVWGNSQTNDLEYSASETESKYFISYISNNRLYYKYYNKSQNANDLDFTFYEEAISHSTCTLNENIYLFRVDLDGNLFFSNIDSFNENFICSDVSNISCCANADTIIFCYISQNKCYYGEIKNNVVISNNTLTTPFGLYKACYIYFNSTNSKFYIVVTNNKNNNYLLESISTANSSSENISANITLTIDEIGDT